MTVANNSNENEELGQELGAPLALSAHSARIYPTSSSQMQKIILIWEHKLSSFHKNKEW